MNIQSTLGKRDDEDPYKDPETLDQLYHGRGLSLRGIGSRLGCHHTTVHRYMIQYGIERRDKNPSSEATSEECPEDQIELVDFRQGLIFDFLFPRVLSVGQNVIVYRGF